MSDTSRDVPRSRKSDLLRLSTRASLTLGAVAAMVVAMTVPAQARPAPDPGASTSVPSVVTPAKGAGPQHTAPVTPTPVQGAKYVVPQRVCPAPKPGQMACDAYVMVPAAKGQAGAVPATAPNDGTGQAGGYTPAQLASIYGFNPAAAAGGQTVAIVDAYNNPSARNDLNQFNSQYGLPAETSTSLRIVNERGNTSPLPVTDVNWGREIDLDLQAVRGVCHACKILLVEGSTSATSSLRIAEATAIRMHATEISNSYGAPEGTLSSSTRSALSSSYNHSGVVITASTGDDGWYGWDFINEGGDSQSAPEFPSSIPGVVSVGGTTLHADGSNKRTSETVWNGNGLDDRNGLGIQPRFASGGGCSHNFTAPSWQLKVAGWSSQGCGSKRLAADVSAVGDPATGYSVYNQSSGGWVRAGGTSLASPLIAAMWALAGGAPGVAHPAQALYDNFRFRSQRGGPFHDVVDGGNAFCGGDVPSKCSAYLRTRTTPPTGNPNNLGDSDGRYAGLLDCHYKPHPSTATIAGTTRQCAATTGYDGPSGVGTPNNLNGFTSLNPTVKIAYTPPLKVHQARAFHVVDYTHPMPGSQADHFTWRWGDGHETVTHSSTVDHTYSKAGHYTVELIVTDNYGRQAVAGAGFTLGVAPTVGIEAPKSAKVGQKVSFHSVSTEHNTGATIVAHHWRIGSHTYLTGNPITFTFKVPGTYSVLLAVYDNAGAKGTKTIHISIVR